MLPVNCGSHADYQNFVVTNLRKYYPDPSALARSTWDIIERFWNLDLSFTDKCKENGITDCKCDRYFSQPDCDIGWDSAHDAMPYYQYFKRENITPFIVLNGKGGRPPVYKNDFTIDKDGVPVFPSGCRMRSDGVEVAKGRMKFKCPKISHKNGCISCTCETPCSDAKYGRTVHLVMKDNPRLFNNPPRSSKEWKLEYNARTSAERSNKREKLDFKLEDGRHRSTKMWYCRLYHILMLQHLDAWNLPSESTLKKMILDVA